MLIIPVILAGGIGERFWPASRSSKPKQLLPLISDESMLRETLNRVLPLCSDGVKPLIVTSALLNENIKSEAESLASVNVIAEPVGRNTAPAIAAAAVHTLTNYGKDAVMLVVSADHAITPREQFVNAAQFGAETAFSKDLLVTFGIKPDRPETGYGYINVGEKIDTSDLGIEISAVSSFVEKPDQKTAESYLSSGNFLWNSGMFIWKTGVILEEFQSYMPEIMPSLNTLMENRDDYDNFFLSSPSQSIDVGIMERSKRVAVLKPQFVWDDIGAWESLARIHGKDECENTKTGDAIFIDECRDSIVANYSNRTLAVVGAENLVVVTVDDATLIISRDKLPNIKKYIAELKSGGFPKELF